MFTKVGSRSICSFRRLFRNLIRPRGCIFYAQFNFNLIINVKMRTIVGSVIFFSLRNTPSESLRAKKNTNFSVF